MDFNPPAENLHKKIHPLRVVLKVLIFFIVFYVLLISYPDITYFFFRRLMPKHGQFPYYVVYHSDSAKHGFALQNVFDINSLFYSHVISGESKPENQYRIIFIGDSTVYTGKIYPLLARYKCSGKVLSAYNLGYPGVSATKDFMILQEAMKYSPDLIIWSITYTIAGNNEGFLRANPDRFAQMVNTYQLSEAGSSSSLTGKTAFYQSDRVRLETYLILYYSILDPATGGTDAIIHTALNDEAYTLEQGSGSAHGDQLSSILRAFKEMTKNIPVLLINEPRPGVIVNMGPYIQFRKDIVQLSTKERINFLDLGNLVPDQDFVDRIHRNDKGEMLFEKAVTPVIKALACGH